MHKSTMILPWKRTHDSCMHRGLLHKYIMTLIGQQNHDSVTHNIAVHKYIMIFAFGKALQIYAPHYSYILA